jgi:hypothetical protein
VPSFSSWSQHRPSETWEDILTTLETMTAKASELATEAKASMAELGRSAGRRMDEARDETGGTLHSAASSVRRGSEAIEDLAAGAADRLDATASYVEDHDLRGALIDLRKFGRRHLTASLVAAAVIGFLAGSAYRRVTHTCGNASDHAQH